MNTDDQDSDDVVQGSPTCCSFCCRRDVGPLVEGPDCNGFGAVYICQDCVELCSEIFEMRKQGHGIGEFDPTALTQKMEEALEPLTGQEREVVRLRYGLADGYTYTLEEVGQKLGITPELVREIEVQVVTRLSLLRDE